MKFGFILIFLIVGGCATHPSIIERPFGFSTNWQEGSSSSHSNQDGSIEINFPAQMFGPRETGFNWASDLEPRDNYTISYDVKFSGDFDFVKGGKLPGLCGGKGKSHAGIKPTGNDKLSARIMWRRTGKVVSYVYHLDQKTGYGDDFEWNSKSGEALRFLKNEWHTINFKLKLNSVSKADGSIVGSFDGVQAINRTGLRFRDSDSLKIDHLCFNTFFGGNDSSWAPSSQQTLWIRNLKVE
jgi:hypothetical protein